MKKSYSSIITNLNSVHDFSRKIWSGDESLECKIIFKQRVRSSGLYGSVFQSEPYVFEENIASIFSVEYEGNHVPPMRRALSEPRGARRPSSS
jgi:hypothetical protein